MAGEIRLPSGYLSGAYSIQQMNGA